MEEKEIIYAIKIAELNYSGLRIIDVKIGKTTNINSTLAQYKRSSRSTEILNLWESNKVLSLSNCEQGVHKAAEKYAYERDSEKFIFLQESYESFSENISLLLKKTTEKELEEYKRTKTETKEGPEGEAKVIDEEKGIKIRGQFFPCRYAREILIKTANWLIEQEKIKKEDLPIAMGKKRYLISRTPIHPKGNNFYGPKELVNGYYLEGNMSEEGCITKAKWLLKNFGYSDKDLELAGFRSSAAIA